MNKPRGGVVISVTRELDTIGNLLVSLLCFPLPVATSSQCNTIAWLIIWPPAWQHLHVWKREKTSIIFFRGESYYIAQAGLKLLGSRDLPTSASTVAGTAGTHQCTQVPLPI